MKCEWESCPNRSKLKISVDTGWVGSYCFQHAYKMLKPLIKQAFKLNRGVYVQKVSENDL